MTSDPQSDPARSRRFDGYALAALALPAVIVIVLAQLWSHGAPCIDDWLSVDAFKRSTEGQTVWPEFFNQRTLHIVPIEALATHLTFLWLHGDMRYLCALAIVLVGVTALMLWRLARPLLAGATGAGAVAVGAWIGFALFSPVHAEIWQWGLCWTVTVPFVALCAGLLMMRWSMAAILRAALLAAVSTFAFFSHGSGVLVGPILWLTLVLSSEKSVPGKRPLGIALTLALLALAAIIAARFDVGQLSKARHIDPDRTSASVATTVQSFLGVLGHPLSLGTTLESMTTSAVIGSVLIVLAAALGLRILLLPKDDPRREAALPWLAVLAFGVANAALIAATRGARSPWPTYTSRYLMLTTPALIAVALLIAAAWRGRLLGLAENWRARGIAVLGAVVATMLCCSWAEGINWMRLWHVKRLQTEALLTYSQLLPWKLVQTIDLERANRSFIPEAAAFLSSRNALNSVTLVPDGRLDRLRVSDKPMPESYGRCTSAVQTSNGVIVVEGYADMRGRGRPADLVVLTHADAVSGAQMILAAGVPDCPADYFDFDLDRRRDRAHYSRWLISLPAGQLASGITELKAWAIDIERREARLIPPAFNADASRRPALPEHLLPFPGKPD